MRRVRQGAGVEVDGAAGGTGGHAPRPTTALLGAFALEFSSAPTSSPVFATVLPEDEFEVFARPHDGVPNALDGVFVDH